MVSKVLPMTNLFRRCREIMERELRPMKYQTLTEMAVASFGKSRRDVDWNDQIEDVREKLLLAGQYGFGYIGKPYAFAYLIEWLPTPTLFNHTKPTTIDANLEAGKQAVFEGLMRSPYLIHKTSAPLEVARLSGANGLLMEAHVKQWFQRRYPSLYRPPDNDHKWTQPCFHDFKLQCGQRLYMVDVAGPLRTGLYGLPEGGGKKPAEIEVLVGIEGNKVVIKGFVAGAEFDHRFTEFESHPFGRLAFYLSCFEYGIPYEVFGIK